MLSKYINIFIYYVYIYYAVKKKLINYDLNIIDKKNE